MFGGTCLGGLDLGVDTGEVNRAEGVGLVLSDVCLLFLPLFVARILKEWMA